MSQHSSDIRCIRADFSKVRGPHPKAFRECVGAGRVGEGLRAGWREQLETCRAAMGFRYLRVHGLLHDELGVYSEDAQGNPVYNWRYLDDYHDYLLSIGIRPFVEIGFMPNALATVRNEEAEGDSGMKSTPGAAEEKRRVSIFWWKGNVTPPKSHEKWENLVEALMRHWVERYGEDEVAQWYFEVWNEPDHSAFFSPNDPHRRLREYCDLYASTAKAIRTVGDRFRVGGPAGAGVDFVAPFIDFCTENNVPLDFLSLHAYGVTEKGGPDGLDEFGRKVLYLLDDLSYPAAKCLEQLPIIHARRPDLPLHITEWSVSYSPRDPIHDTYVCAPCILANIKRAGARLASMSYWTFTDIFEEPGVPTEAFHGGFGLLNVHGLRKPAWFAYEYLHRLGDEELENDDANSIVCRSEGGGVQVLLWNLTHPTEGKISNHKYARTADPARDLGEAVVELRGLRPGLYTLEVRRVGYRQNDVYTAYLEMGAPAQLSRGQEAALRAACTGEPVEVATVEVPAAGTYRHALSLRTNDTVLLTLTLEGVTS